MRILMTNLNLVKPRGSEIWCWTVARELQKRGHDVEFYSREYGNFAVEVLAPDFSLLGKVGVYGKIYDLAIVNHGQELIHGIASAIVDCPAIMMSHGPLSVAEKPAPSLIDGHVYVAVSEETAMLRSAEMSPDCMEKSDFIVIRNPVAPEWFLIEGQEPQNSPYILWANHREKPPGGLVLAAAERKIETRNCYKTEMMPWEIMSLVSGADVVIGTGRWVYEAMAAGRPVIVAANGRTAGYVTTLNYRMLRCHNMTTRSVLTREVNGTSQWNRELGVGRQIANPDLREIAKQEHHVEVIVNQLFGSVGL